MSAVRDEQRDVRAIVQRWLDGTERTYASHAALRDLAVLLRLERGRCACTREPGDSRCPVHRTCAGCGATPEDCATRNAPLACCPDCDHGAELAPCVVCAKPCSDRICISCERAGGSDEIDALDAAEVTS